jgi:hypothetical protein
MPCIFISWPGHFLLPEMSQTNCAAWSCAWFVLPSPHKFTHPEDLLPRKLVARVGATIASIIINLQKNHKRGCNLHVTLGQYSA